MSRDNKSIFSQEVPPYTQAALVFGVMFLFAGGGKLAALAGVSLPPEFPWMMAVAFMLVFAIFNSVFCLSAGHMGRYFQFSMLSYAALAALSAGVAYLLSGLWLDGIGSLAWIFLVFTMGYFVFMAIMGTIRFLVGFINEEEKRKLSGKQRRRRKRR